MTTTPFLKNTTVKVRLKKVAQSRKSMQIVYDREMRRLDAEVADIQARCEHTHVVFYPDPAGGSDSSYECRVCGYHSRYRVEADEQRAKEVRSRQSCPRGQ